MRVYNVFAPYNNHSLAYRLIDTVYFTNQCDADYVKYTLIEHDGFSRDIIVEEVK